VSHAGDERKAENNDSQRLLFSHVCAKWRLPPPSRRPRPRARCRRRLCSSRWRQRATRPLLNKDGAKTLTRVVDLISIRPPHPNPTTMHQALSWLLEQ